MVSRTDIQEPRLLIQMKLSTQMESLADMKTSHLVENC